MVNSPRPGVAARVGKVSWGHEERSRVMKRWWIGCSLVFAAATAASAQPRNLDWVDVGATPPGNPNTWSQLPAPIGASDGQLFYFSLDNGDNIDTNGGGTSHFDPEGVGAGTAFRGQAWVRFDGLQGRLKS